MAQVTEADVKSLETKLQSFADGLSAGEREVLDAAMTGAKDIAEAEDEVQGFQWLASGHWALRYNPMSGYESTFVFNNVSWYDAPPASLPAGVWRYFTGPDGKPMATLVV